jgi:polar amino acid transport system substrate-binding protein
MPGVRIAVVRDHASIWALSRILKNAELLSAASPSLPSNCCALEKQTHSRRPAVCFCRNSSKRPGSRVLEAHYGANLLRMVVSKNQAARLAYISEFIEQAKASGLVQLAIERAGLPGYKVAPTKAN